MRHILALLSLAGLLVFFSCKKENGRFFVRIIIPSDTTIKDLSVNDAIRSIPVDCTYYPAENNLEISYTLSHVMTSQIINWTSSMPWQEYDYQNVSIHEYLGELEKDSKDKYYTLTVGYTIRQSDAIHNGWVTPAYDFYGFDYINHCNLTYTYYP